MFCVWMSKLDPFGQSYFSKECFKFPFLKIVVLPLIAFEITVLLLLPKQFQFGELL